jgi:hypothetical protein
LRENFEIQRKNRFGTGKQISKKITTIFRIFENRYFFSKFFFETFFENLIFLREGGGKRKNRGEFEFSKKFEEKFTKIFRREIEREKKYRFSNIRKFVMNFEKIQIFQFLFENPLIPSDRLAHEKRPFE